MKTSMQVDLPRDMFELLKQRGEARGVTLTQQILEALAAYLDELDDPILLADDPIFYIAGATASAVGDLSTHHDHYLYHKDWQTRGERTESRLSLAPSARTGEPGLVK